VLYILSSESENGIALFIGVKNWYKLYLDKVVISLCLWVKNAPDVGNCLLTGHSNVYVDMMNKAPGGGEIGPSSADHGKGGIKRSVLKESGDADQPGD
jgi:hypothetical protein